MFFMTTRVERFPITQRQGNVLWIEPNPSYSREVNLWHAINQRELAWSRLGMGGVQLDQLQTILTCQKEVNRFAPETVIYASKKNGDDAYSIDIPHGKDTARRLLRARIQTLKRNQAEFAQLTDEQLPKDDRERSIKDFEAKIITCHEGLELLER